MDCRVFSLPKRSDTPEENQDAAGADAGTARFAVADGATEGYPSGLWARMLVASFVQNLDCRPADWLSSLPALQQQWSDRFAGQKLPWYGEEQLAHGAFSTFLGVVLEKNESRPPVWSAMAVGDSCLFHVRGGTLRRAFPLANSGQFGTLPRLVGSRISVEAVQGRQVFACEEYVPGDRLWLMTDALAQWFLRQDEAGGRPWEELEPLISATKDADAFAAWIEHLRDERQIRNDDVTLCKIDL
jgi:hypothetical protein